MPPNRLEQPTLGPDSVSPAPAPILPPAPGGALRAWLPLVITVLAMPVLAYAMTTFVLVPKLRSSLAAAGESGDGRVAEGKKQSLTMNKLLVNVAGTMGSRYLLVSLTLSGSDPEFRGRIQEYDPQMRDMACSALSAKTLVDLEKPTARNLIRTELITGFNNILGEMLVQDICITEFVIQ
jgi:flagellar FliL protein